MSSDSMSMVTGVMQQSGLTMSPPTVDGMQLLSEEERFQERRRDILVLVMRFLVDYGFLSAYQTLCTEAATSLDQVDAADNIDLMTIVQEFVDYYYCRFGRYPKLVRHNYMPPTSFQMPMQQMPQSIQQIHAMQLQAAVAAAQTAAQVKVQQQLQQQQQNSSAPKAPQVTLPQAMSLTQPMLSQPSLTTSMAMPVSGLPGISQALSIPPLTAPSMSAAMSTAALGVNMQQASTSPPTKQQQQQQQQQQQYVQVTPLRQIPQIAVLGAQQQQQQQQQQQRPAERVIPATAQVERVQIAYLDATQGSTCKIGTSEPVDQVAFVAVLSAAPPTDLPSRYFSYRQPSKKSKRGSERFNASDVQEEVMYALVGCSDVGWSSRNITTDTREFLLKHYGIEKGTITTFFKNRSQRKPYSLAADGHGRRSSAASSRTASRTGSSAGAASKQAAAAAAAASKLSSAAANNIPAVISAPFLASTAPKGVTMPVSGLSAAAVSAPATTMCINAVPALPMITISPALSPAAGLAPLDRPIISAAMTDCDALPDASYAGLDGLVAFRGLDGLCRQSSLPGLSSAMSLPCGLDSDNYLGSDLDMTASGMGLVAGDVCCSPCGFSS